MCFPSIASADNHFQQHRLDLIGDDRFKSDFRRTLSLLQGDAVRTLLSRRADVAHGVSGWKDDARHQVLQMARDRRFDRVPGQSQRTRSPAIRLSTNSGGRGRLVTSIIMVPIRIFRSRTRVFVETVGGDLTDQDREQHRQRRRHLRRTGRESRSDAGRCRDPLRDRRQSGAAEDTALPRDSRHGIWSTTARSSKRCDWMTSRTRCVMLPGDQGLIFPGGYYLQTGEFKRFDHGLTDMRYQRTIASPNGEDFLYLFYNPGIGNLRPAALQPDSANGRNTADLSWANVL